MQLYEVVTCYLGAIPLGSVPGTGFFIDELYDVQFLAGVQRLMVLNQERKEIRQVFTVPELNYWLRPSAVISND